MKIVVDTNIVFSAILNTNGTIGDLLFNSDKILTFYSCSYMRFEINKHKAKLVSISKLTEQQLEEAIFRVFSQINFINEELIPEKTWLKAESIALKIDIDDIDFIALSKHLKATLWTGDKVLYNGLKDVAFKNVTNTQELAVYRNSAKL